MDNGEKAKGNGNGRRFIRSAQISLESDHLRIKNGVNGRLFVLLKLSIW
jgi:hypothetical protein